MDDELDLLDRRYQSLKDSEDAEFVRELARFYEFITDGPESVRAALELLRADAAEHSAAFDRHEQELIPELMALRQELVRLAPETDDSGVTRPGLPHDSMEWGFSFANFDALAANRPDHLVVNDASDPSHSRMMAQILSNKLHNLQWMTTSERGLPMTSETNLRPDLDDLARRLRNLRERHRHAAQELAAASERGGFQVQALDLAIGQMNPKPQESHSEEDDHRYMNDLFMRVAGGWTYIEDVMAGRPLSEVGRNYIDVLVPKLKPAAARVYDDLRMRMATTPPAPAPTYPQRLRAWTRSPGFGFTGGTCIAAIVTGAIGNNHAGLVTYAVLAIALAVVPPAIPALPTSRTRGPHAYSAWSPRRW